jgi:ELWxxDGT repeat protein
MSWIMVLAVLLFATVAGAQDRYLSSWPERFTPAGDQVFFTAGSAKAGRELWRTDGTTAGTRMVRDLTPGPSSSYFGQFRAGGGVIYFVRQESSSSWPWELWKSDGTEATLLSAGTQSQIYLIGLTRNGFVYAADTYSPLSSSVSRDLFVVDGTDPRPRRIGPSRGFPSSCVLGGEAFVLWGDGVWRTDGTEAGTRLHFPTTSGSRIFVAGDTLYLLDDGGQLWHLPADGPAVQLAQLVTGNLIAVEEGTDGFFLAMEPIPGRLALWRSDGTPSGTMRVLVTNGWDSFSGLEKAGDQVFFTEFQVLTAFDAKNGVKRQVLSGTVFRNTAVQIS